MSDITVIPGITITREVVFTDYQCNESSRHSVSVWRDDEGQPIALIKLAPTELPHEEKEPDMLRSLAQCLLAAADEMEGK